ncbi:ABC transporter ATP-binding protein [Enterococcus sp. HY326]|uniref:ABC transporter ATP-binding protein n=1 Tax=Enterococcus sp. HY326 TaxID=2971265 RepID=UPI00224007F7|nr:ABC transporter ATP-binding protein [Enterococcus sp. HY326]
MVQLLKYAKNYRKQVILGPIFKFLEAVFELLLPLLMAALIDQGITAGNRSEVIRMTIWMIVLSVVGLICAMICQYYASIASQGFGTELRNQLMNKINHFSHSQLNEFGTDTLITRMTSDINQLQLALAMLIRLVIRAPFLSIGSVVMAFYINWQMGLIFLLLLPLFCIILFFIVTKTVPLYRQVQQKLDRINELVSQNLSGVRVIRAFARRNTEKKNFNDSTDDLSKVYLRVSNISALLSPATTFIMNMGIVALLYFGGIRVNIGSLQQGEVVALVNYMNQMLLALIVVSNLVVIFTRAAASSTRIKEVLASETNLSADGSQAIETSSTKTLLAFNNVDFRYTADSGLALENISFTMANNSILGIIGATGSGKSTLTQLIPRFYDATAGQVTFAEIDVKDWSLTKLRSQVAMVPQKAVLFNGTIRENLQWGKAAATDEECYQALAIAQCLEFVQQLPNGLDTKVEEGGKNFSGGQQQRLCIARGLMAQSQLLILDDSLSALDYQTDLLLRQALKRDYQGAVIIISQRVRSIQSADQILVMENGRLADMGRHSDLLQQSAVYREIVASQAETDQEVSDEN